MENDKIRERSEQNLLESYFADKLNFKVDEKMVVETKSTAEIQEELEPMLSVSKDTIFDYLVCNGYKMMRDFAGNVKWGLWVRQGDI